MEPITIKINKRGHLTAEDAVKIRREHAFDALDVDKSRPFYLSFGADILGFQRDFVSGLLDESFRKGHALRIFWEKGEGCESPAHYNIVIPANASERQARLNGDIYHKAVHDSGAHSLLRGLSVELENALNKGGSSRHLKILFEIGKDQMKADLFETFSQRLPHWYDLAQDNAADDGSEYAFVRMRVRVKARTSPLTPV